MCYFFFFVELIMRLIYLYNNIQEQTPPFKSNPFPFFPCPSDYEAPERA